MSKQVWKSPEETPKDRQSYDCCTIDVLVKCEDPIQNWDKTVYTVGHKDYDGDEVVWVLQHSLSKRLIVKGWKYIDE